MPRQYLLLPWSSLGPIVWNLASKNESLGYPWWKLHDPTVSSFDALPACDRQTDRQTDTWPIAKSRSSMAERDKNCINPLIATLKPQGNGPPFQHCTTLRLKKYLCDWHSGRWWVGCYIWWSEEGTGRGRSPPSPLLAVPNVTAHPSTASVPTSYYSM